MIEFIVYIGIALLAAIVVWGFILFLLSPELMGPMAPNAAFALRRIFTHAGQLKYETVGRGVRNAALAAATFGTPVEYSLAAPPSPYYVVTTAFTGAQTDISRSVR